MQKITFFFLILFSVSHSTFGQSKAFYNITFNSIWNASDHTTIPNGAHWSKLVGVSHKTENLFLKTGETASTGIKNIAELGSNAAFENEVNTKINSNEANQYINGPALSSAEGTIAITNLEMDAAYPLLTLISMIAPSPDWMIAINSYNLLDTNGNWKSEVILDVFAYDAGTDSGTNYTSSNLETNPFEPITMISGTPFHGNKIGTLAINLQSILSVTSEKKLSDLKIYPNPTAGIINIAEPSKELIENIFVYDLLGKQVAFRKSNSNKKYDFSKLKKGIYVLKVVSKNNDTKTQKLVIE